MSESNLILVNEQDLPIGSGEKLDIHRRGLLHRAFSVFLYDRAARKTLLQFRARGKYHSGGLWTNSCCSHFRAGETAEESIRGSLLRELGLSVPSLEIRDSGAGSPADPGILWHGGSFLYQASFPDGMSEHEIDHVYVLPCLEQPLNATNPEEIEDWQWIRLDDLLSWRQEHPEQFTAWFAPALELALRTTAFLDAG